MSCDGNCGEQHADKIVMTRVGVFANWRSVNSFTLSFLPAEEQAPAGSFRVTLTEIACHHGLMAHGARLDKI